MVKLLKLGSIFGIRFQVHFSWFIIFILLTVSLVYPNYSQWLSWVMGIVASFLLFASVIAHELAHSLVGRANGISITSITLFIFGGVARMTREATRPGAEFKMAIAGPICSLVLAGLFALIWFLLPDITGPAAIMLLWLAIMNGVLAVFNLIPGFPLDGGRVFRALLWRVTGSYVRATRTAARVGQGIGWLIVLAGVVLAFLQPYDFSFYNGLWIAFIGLFLLSAASASYRQVRPPEPAPGGGGSETLPPD